MFYELMHMNSGLRPQEKEAYLYRRESRQQRWLNP